MSFPHIQNVCVVRNGVFGITILHLAVNRSRDDGLVSLFPHSLHIRTTTFQVYRWRRHDEPSYERRLSFVQIELVDRDRI